MVELERRRFLNLIMQSFHPDWKKNHNRLNFTGLIIRLNGLTCSIQCVVLSFHLSDSSLDVKETARGLKLIDTQNILAPMKKNVY